MPNTDRSATATWDIAVELKNVTKVFVQKQNAEGGMKHLFKKESKNIVALNDVSMTVRKGEFVAYAGPNGAGKSTTFKLLCGMLAPGNGTVRTLEMDPIRRRIPVMEKIGVLFGNRTELWWDHPVAASFRWKKAVWNIPDEVYARQMELVTDMLDLAPFMGTFVRELSLGQRMRAELGLMLLHAPELILLDEPTLGLDVLAKRRMIDTLKALNATQGTTILVTSHDLDDLTEMAKRIVLLAQGRIAFDGTLAQLRQVTGEERTITLATAGARPQIQGAEFAFSEEGRHTYTFTPSETPVSRILAQVAAIDGVADVELGRPPIEQAIAGLYSQWKPKDPQ